MEPQIRVSSRSNGCETTAAAAPASKPDASTTAVRGGSKVGLPCAAHASFCAAMVRVITEDTSSKLTSLQAV